ncbi:MAG: hypothetical protein ACI808_003414 [Paraglaciecola sp.]|jgi:hypothetical protein
MKSKLVLLCVIAILGTSACVSTDNDTAATTDTKNAKSKKQASADCATTTGSRLKKSC